MPGVEVSEVRRPADFRFSSPGMQAYVIRLENDVRVLKQEVLRQHGLAGYHAGARFGPKADTPMAPPPPPPSTGRRRGAQPGHRGHGRHLPEGLPTRVENHELPPDQRHCPCCGLPYEETPVWDESSEVDVGQPYVVIRHHRRRYRRVCRCPGPRFLAAAPPLKLIPKGKFSFDFWIQVLLDKHLHLLPLERQAKAMRAAGLPVSTGTLVGGMRVLAERLKPLYDLMGLLLKNESHWHADETDWPVFLLKGQKWYLWVFVSPRMVFFVVASTKSAEVPQAVLGPHARGIVSADRWGAYKALGPRILVSFCWAHVRRDFIKVQKQYPFSKELVRWAQTWIDAIGLLYKLNAARLACRFATPEFEARERRLNAHLGRMRGRAMRECRTNVKPKAKVMESLLRHWEGLTLFVRYPFLPLDNNAAERAHRTPVLGRKNFYGSQALWSAELAAMAFSISQTALLHGLNPHAYLRQYLEVCALNAGQPPKDLRPFLPWRLKETAPRLRLDRGPP